MTSCIRFAVAGCLMFLAVGAGAFGSHGLRNLVAPDRVEAWETAVLYHLVHGLALLVVALLHAWRPSKPLAWAWGFMLLGVCLFSGSIYTIVLTGARWLGPVTPLGGVTLMLSWLLLAWAGTRRG
ncbi:MAG: DUF423 domain-containing protein [Xanthomonadaceae bacterium]|nr:DUF423 domain-containing protein [Xanthomonadaceae bacterium]